MPFLYGHKWNCWLITLVAISATSDGHIPTSEVDKTDGPKGSMVGTPGSGGQARYDFYRIYNVEFSTEQHIEVFQKLEKESDFTFFGHTRQVGQKLSILVASHRIADLENLLITYGMKFKILTYNFQEKIDKNYKEVLPIGTDVNLYDWNHYFHLETIYEWLRIMSIRYHVDLTLQDMGTSTQGLSIKGVKIKAREPNKKTIFIESGIHAREWIAPAVATYIIHKLLATRDPAIQKLAADYNWIIFPCVNPDGYKYTFTHDRMWRKNRQLFGTCCGVDLNRNYPAQWNTFGSSSDPCRYDYAGPEAASELETKRVMDYIKNNVETDEIKAYIALHSYSQMIMFPHAYTKDHVKNYADLKKFGERASQRIKQSSGRDYKSGCLFETVYPSSGVSTDWAYSEANIPIAFTFELRGPPDNEDLFLLPSAEILPTAMEAFAAIQTIIEGATAKGYFD